MDNSGVVLHWYDFLCPFYYVGQHRNAILVRYRLPVVELPFQAHPEIVPGGISVGPRNGPMYEMLEQEAKRQGKAGFPPAASSPGVRRSRAGGSARPVSRYPKPRRHW